MAIVGRGLRSLGTSGAGLLASGAVVLALWTFPVGLSHAEAPAPAPASCPPAATTPGSAAPGAAAPSAITLGATTPSAITPGATAPSAIRLSASTPSAGAPSAGRSSSPYRPSAEEVVACVDSQEISGATFAHWAVVAGRADSPSHRHPSAEPTPAEMAQVMGFLISADWVMGEAAERHIHLSSAEVSRRFAKLRRQQFSKPAQFRAFLRSTGQTLGDLLLRVRLSMLTTRIQAQVTGHGGPRTKLRRLNRFVRQFSSRWKAQTYCESLYAVPNCGHTASSL